jgi:hypothetical protein
MKMEQSVPKRRNIKFRRRGITQKKAYNTTSHIIWSPVMFRWPPVSVTPLDVPRFFCFSCRRRNIVSVDRYSCQVSYSCLI